MNKAIEDVMNERNRQQSEEGYSLEHDDLYKNGQLSEAAGCYALHAHDKMHDEAGFVPAWFPFSDADWKPKSPREDLVRAAALIIAEIERLDRKESKNGNSND